MSEAEKQLVAKRYVNARIFTKGRYTALTNKHNSAVVVKYNTSMSNNREMLKEIWHWWLDSDSGPENLQHRTTLSRVIEARSYCTLDAIHKGLENDDVHSFTVIIDSSERDSRSHTPVIVLYSKGNDVHAKLWADTVVAGKKGKDQAVYLYNCFNDLVRPKWQSIIYDTTGSNTSKRKGLKAKAEALLERPLFEILCFLHVIALAQLDFTTTICGKVPKLQSGAQRQNSE